MLCSVYICKGGLVVRKYISFFLIIIYVFLICLPTVFSENNKITVNAEIDTSAKRVRIYGDVETTNRQMVTIVVTKPSGELDYIDQLDILEDKIFEFTYILEGQEEGTYVVEVNSSVDGSAATSFAYKKKTPKDPEPDKDPDSSPDTPPYDDKKDKDEVKDELDSEVPDDSFDDIEDKELDTEPFRGKITALPEIEDSKAVIDIKKETLLKAFEQTGIFEIALIKVIEVEGIDEYIIEIPAEAFVTSRNNKQIGIITPFATVTVPLNLLEGQLDKTDNVNKISKVRVVIGNNEDGKGSTTLAIKILLDNKELVWNLNTKISIHVPYKLSNEESKYSDYIVAHYIDDNGRLTPIPNSGYNLFSEGVDFKVSKSGKFNIVLVKKEFNDINNYLWAKRHIEALAARGIIKGTSEKTYSPELNINRADFLLLLVRAFELNATIDSNFDDVNSSDYYYEAVGVAKKLGLSKGTGNNMFNPKTSILRQDMMVLIYNALEIIDNIKFQKDDNRLMEFEDALDISSYAVDSIAFLVDGGIVKGSGNRIMPLENATRAEAAVLIYRLFNFINR